MANKFCVEQNLIGKDLMIGRERGRKRKRICVCVLVCNTARNEEANGYCNHYPHLRISLISWTITLLL